MAFILIRLYDKSPIVFRLTKLLATVSGDTWTSSLSLMHKATLDRLPFTGGSFLLAVSVLGKVSAPWRRFKWGINVGLMLSGFKRCIYIYIKDQTLPLGSCESFTWIILKTSLVWFWTLRICIFGCGSQWLTVRLFLGGIPWLIHAIISGGWTTILSSNLMGYGIKIIDRHTWWLEM